MVVFDMAGTVVDEKNVVYKTLQKALNRGGINVTLDQVLADGAGKEKSKAMRDIVLRYNARLDSIDAMYADFLQLLNDAYRDLDVVPMPGAPDVLEQLKHMGIYRVLNTGYNRPTADQLLAKLDWEKGLHFDQVITATDVARTRPFPDMILLAMNLLGIHDPGFVLKVGDSAIDIEEGKNAKCGLTVGITTGAHTRKQLEAAKPDYIIDAVRELLPIVNGSIVGGKLAHKPN
jgi:phosphonatase-like hydrolase